VGLARGPVALGIDMADVICLSPSHLHVDGSLGICVGESWREFESRYFGRLVEAMRRILRTRWVFYAYGLPRAIGRGSGVFRVA
jgi:hypothetical protein